MRKALYIGGGILVLIVLVVVFFRPSSSIEDTRPISALLADVRAEGVAEIEISGDMLTVTRIDGTVYESNKEHGTSLFAVFADNDVDASGVVIEVDDGLDFGSGLGLVITFLPLLIFGGIVSALIMAIRRIPRQ
jgi:ATP-dependent Zn protease